LILLFKFSGGLDAEEKGGIASGFVECSMLLSTRGLAKRVRQVVLGWPGSRDIIFVVCGYLMSPFTMQLIDVRWRNATCRQSMLERAKSMAHMIGSFTMFAIPVFAMLFMMLLALLVTVTGSMVGLATKFRDVFSIMAACSLIRPAILATYVVLNRKATTLPVRPNDSPFGLDIFVNVHGPLFAILNFFSIFEIWYLVIFALTLAISDRSIQRKGVCRDHSGVAAALLFKIIGTFFRPKA